MKSSFNYCNEVVSHDTFEILDIGNVALQALNDHGQGWILFIKTNLGYSYILEYGPYNVDSNKSIQYIQSLFQCAEYSEYRLSRIIDKFLNDGKRQISQVIEINEDEVRNIIKNLIEVFDEAYQ